MRNPYVFTGCASPFHSDVYVSGHFKDLAAVAFLATSSCGLKKDYPCSGYL